MYVCMYIYIYMCINTTTTTTTTTITTAACCGLSQNGYESNLLSSVQGARRQTARWHDDDVYIL